MFLYLLSLTSRLLKNLLKWEIQNKKTELKRCPKTLSHFLPSSYPPSPSPQALISNKWSRSLAQELSFYNYPIRLRGEDKLKAKKIWKDHINGPCVTIVSILYFSHGIISITWKKNVLARAFASIFIREMLNALRIEKIKSLIKNKNIHFKKLLIHYVFISVQYFQKESEELKSMAFIFLWLFLIHDF